jgi:diguanylate cyclase (GGDEF)-like protein
MSLALATVRYFDRQHRWVLLSLASLAVAVLGLLDYATGHETTFALFYLAPVTFAAWHLGVRWGLFFSLVCVVVWLVANALAGATYSSAWIPYWNGFTRLAVFVIVVLLLSALRKGQEHARELARTDSLTGAVNRRWFGELLNLETGRCRRYRRPFSVIYSDIDNFKAVNDQLGHSKGDKLLQTVTATLKHEGRATDIVARLGGDEFGMLLPETGRIGAKALSQRLRRRLMEAMAMEAWPVSFSFGVVTCLEAPHSVDDLLHLADQLMYAVKQEGKNGIRHEVIGVALTTEAAGIVTPFESGDEPSRGGTG